MVYYCADDYGISEASNERIEKCLREGVLNKVSVLPNGLLDHFQERLAGKGICLSLHINLVEGAPLSDPKELDLLVTDQGYFRYSFAGLFLLSLSGKRKRLRDQIHKEIQAQVRFWKETMGEGTPLCLDSHQHTHLIPLIFRTLLQVIEEENVTVSSLRVPAEPLMPYLLTPSLYPAYLQSGLVKHCILKVLKFVNYGALKKSKLTHPCFVGAMFSGRLTEDKINKLLPHYQRIAKRRGQAVEFAMHPGSMEPGEKTMPGVREDFTKFYLSPWRKREFHTLLNFHLKEKAERRS